MPSRQLNVRFLAQDPARLAAFWAALLGRPVVEERRGLLLPGDDGEIALRFTAGADRKSGLDRMHLHLASTSADHQRETVDAALGLGARHLDVGQTADDEHVVLADPELNELCVIEAGNTFLDGCGLLAEVACEGSRDVGVFWSRALEWPLVWDSEQETAVQLPGGGTKVAWSGVRAQAETPGRLQLELTVDEHEQAAEVDRLVQLGASRHPAREDGDTVVLADPDGCTLFVGRG